MSWEILQGDCLDILPTLEPSSASVVIADPPYIIGGTSIGKTRAKSGTWADMMNAAVWYREVFLASARVLRVDGWLLVFGNWRSLPTYLKAVTMTGGALFPSSCQVWDKEWISTSARNALRTRWELILWLGMPDAKIPNRSAPDVIAHKWQAVHMGGGHPAEKPRGLIRELLQIAAPDGGLVVDPFAGSGAAGLAALDLGMRYVGIEDDERWIVKARAALGGYVRQMGLF